MAGRLKLATWLLRYGLVVNAGTAAVFYYDKQQAIHKGWRVPERTLQTTALLGGWPAGYAAMDAFRHKTRKQPFRNEYHLAAGANIVLLALAGLQYRKNPAQLMRRLGQPWTQVQRPGFLRAPRHAGRRRGGRRRRQRPRRRG